MCDKTVTKGEKITLERGKSVNVQAEANRTGAGPQRKKLPPEPGRVEPETHVPEDDVLNKGLEQLMSL